ncbi:tyrosine decarboxylase 1-like [Lotus japonicus]|uniref:tyrosine decarboxylase 1-like n=1 Tax=Lotus japonicus TaxID=34305 RepID=UPI00258A5485|nr:tyrosine decarboxylase 1-like [Lotus japonicus]
MEMMNTTNLKPQSDSPKNMNLLDPEEFKRQGYMMIDFLADYYRNINSYPVLSNVEPGYLQKRLPTSAPSHPESVESILEDVQQHILPGITHWLSPNFYAYFPSTSSIAGLMGEILSTGFNAVGFNWVSSPAATELETIVMDWLGQALNLPKTFLFSEKNGGGGVLLGTTCEAILCTLVAARDQKLSQVGKENISKLVVYGSDQTHSALQKAAQIAGIHPQNFRAIKTKRSSAFALTTDSLLSAILQDLENGLIPCFLCANMGTTATTTIDPIGPLCDVAKEYGIWVHVDAAYAGPACICPEFRHCIDGVEKTDSFSFNAHKWFLTGLSCCCLWVKDHTALNKSLTTTPEFLRNKASESKQVIDYKDWQVTLSRKFNALKLWFVLRSYGIENLRNFFRNHVQTAKTFDKLVKMDARFEIVAPRSFSLVCFRISPVAVANWRSNGTNSQYNGEIMITEDLVNEINQKLLDSINSSGKAYMTQGKVEGAFFIRC